MQRHQQIYIYIYIYIFFEQVPRFSHNGGTSVSSADLFLQHRVCIVIGLECVQLMIYIVSIYKYMYVPFMGIYMA